MKLHPLSYCFYLPQIFRGLLLLFVFSCVCVCVHSVTMLCKHVVMSALSFSNLSFDACRYNTLFLFLLKIKRAQMELTSCWLQSRRGVQHVQNTWRIRHRMLYFVNNLLYYLLVRFFLSSHLHTYLFLFDCFVCSTCLF